MVQRYVASKIQDERLQVYVVWAPIRDLDNEKAARDAAKYLTAPRVRHFWMKDLSLPEAFKAPLGLQKSIAWDVYLLFPAGVTWQNSVPTPVLAMHLDREEMPPGSTLNGVRLAEEVRKLLPRARK